VIGLVVFCKNQSPECHPDYYFPKKIMNKIKKKAIKNLLHTKEEDVAIFETLELYLTDRIVTHKEGHRSQDLAGIQKKIEETSQFIKFLKKLI